VRGEIVDLQRRTGTTMIYVTHDQVEAMTMGQRIAVLSGGRLQQFGSTQALYETPANTFVAGFIGTQPMNLIPRLLLQGAAERATAAGNQPVVNWLSPLCDDTDCHTAGVRPEHVAINRDPQAPGLPGEIVQTEYLGHETLVHFTLSGLGLGDTRAIFIARVDGSPHFDNGQDVSVLIDGNQLSRFDRNGERRVD
jgi:ABC-type sugar transport system ATPase subunit